MRGFPLAVALSLIGAGCALAPQRSADHDALVAAERTFARHADDADVRTAFLAAFADDGIWMTPAPMTLRDAHAQRPPPADPRAVRLQWEPVASAIAASGDFGFTSGPSLFSMRDGSRPPQHGAYFSVWKRDARGQWRVVLDAGIAATEPIAPDALLPSPLVRPSARSADANVDALLAIERTGVWTADGLGTRLASDARLYRRGPPAFGAQAIRTALADNLPHALEPLGGDVASSGDLAYTYGAWRGERAAGHYVHLWTRDAAGAWRVAVAIRLDG